MHKAIVDIAVAVAAVVAINVACNQPKTWLLRQESQSIHRRRRIHSCPEMVARENSFDMGASFLRSSSVWGRQECRRGVPSLPTW